MWSEHTLSTEFHISMAQYRALEPQLRDSVTEAESGGGTVVERMVQWFRTRLYRFSVLARGHALPVVRAGIIRELSDNQQVDSNAREYNASASYDHKSGLCRGGGDQHHSRGSVGET